MTVAVLIKRCAFLALLVGFLSCTGGGTGGTGSPVVAQGTVTGLGSVVVNGITFALDNATILRNDRPGGEADLQLGQVVTVRGTLDPGGVAGTADTVVVDQKATGPVERLELATNSLVVLGQTIRVDAMTQFGATPLAALTVGNIIEVSGFVDAEGVLRATRLDRTQDAFTPGTELAIEGTISHLEMDNRTFMLQALRIDFTAAQLTNLPGAQLRNGQVVTVRSTQNVMRGVLLADRVTGKEVGVRGEPGEMIELQGIITEVTATDAFAVNGQVVYLTPATVFERGVGTDITVNVRVEVEGVFAEDGRIIVQAVEFGPGIERAGLITGVTAADTFTLNGQPVRLTPVTAFEGGTANDIAVNVSVKVEGFFTADGVLVATEIDFLIERAGLITGVTAADTFTLNGQPVRLTPATAFEGGTATDIAVNVRVEVKGFFAADGVLVATEIEFL